MKSIVKKPRGHLRDSGLANHFLNTNTREALLRHPRAASILEAFVIEEILQGMGAGMCTWQVHYLFSFIRLLFTLQI